MLLSNPLAHPFLPTLSLTLAGLFASSFLALLVAVRGSWRALSSSSLFQRWRTWVVIAPLFSLAALSGPLGLAVFAGAVALQGSREYARLAALPNSDRLVLFLAALGVPSACLVLPWERLGLLLVLLPLVASLPVLLEQDIERGLHRLPRLAFGLWYLPVSLALLVLIGRHPNGGAGLILAIGLGVALSDVGAFVAGSLFGRRPMASRLSPSKTWAGLAGNFVGAALGLALLSPLAPGAPLLACVPIIAIGSAWGDLLESLLKRAAHFKDSGDWLPGFGGLLDRADSLLVVLPLVFALLEVSA